MVMSEVMKQTNLNLVVKNPFLTYHRPETWPIYDMKSNHQISETRALALLYSVPNHNEWMKAIRETMLLAVHVCSPHSGTELRAIIKKEIPKLLSKSDNIEINLICEKIGLNATVRSN
uniref:Uncharacterized protein n=1 Tax=Romanomermis culicivorax TaxID=13658 RepID=A0A915K5W5_ROMCU